MLSLPMWGSSGLGGLAIQTKSLIMFNLTHLLISTAVFAGSLTVGAIIVLLAYKLMFKKGKDL